MTTMTIPVRLDLDTHAAIFGKAMNHLDNAATRELIRIRASQLNGCAYCVDTHSRDALAVGETAQRIFALPVWQESMFFTDRERAAIAFTESVTRVAATHVPEEDFAAVAEHFTPDELGAMLSLIVTINAWNALGAAARPWQPELEDAR